MFRVKSYQVLILCDLEFKAQIRKTPLRRLEFYSLNNKLLIFRSKIIVWLIKVHIQVKSI